MPAEKVVDKAREARMESRKSSKPIMEKRRRARINESLTELKTLILEALNKDSSRHSKLEKADILEMTVKHLRNLQRQQMAAAVSTDPSLLGKYRSGFTECMTEVSRVMGSMDGVDPQVKQRLIGHLAGHQPATNVMTYAGVHPAAFPHVQPVQVQVPASASVPMQRLQLSPAQGAYPQAIQTTMYGGIPVVPGHFVGGEPVAVLLPSGQTIVQTNGQQQQVVPVQYTNAAVVSASAAAQTQGLPSVSVSSPNGLSQTMMPSHPVSAQAPTKDVSSAPIPVEKMWRPW